MSQPPKGSRMSNMASGARGLRWRELDFQGTCHSYLNEVLFKNFVSRLCRWSVP